MHVEKGSMYNHTYNHAYNYITVDYQQIVYSNIANQILGFTTDYGKFVLINNKNTGFLRANSQLGAAELVIALRKRGRVV